mgnify:CR=1 FL=1
MKPGTYNDFGPFGLNFKILPFDDADAFEKELRENPNVAGVMLEPIQGEAGVNIEYAYGGAADSSQTASVVVGVDDARGEQQLLRVRRPDQPRQLRAANHQSVRGPREAEARVVRRDPHVAHDRHERSAAVGDAVVGVAARQDPVALGVALAVVVVAGHLQRGLVALEAAHQVGLDALAEDHTRLGVALGEHGLDAGLTDEEGDHRLGVLGRGEKIDIADDLLVAAQAAGERFPSEETQAIIIAMLREREKRK